MDTTWKENAACSNANNPDVFFPDGEKTLEDIRKIQKAKVFCVNCLVVAQCLEYAQKPQNSLVFGVG